VHNKPLHVDNPEIRARNCGQFSLATTYTQAEDVDSHDAPVEHPKIDRYLRSGEPNYSHLAGQAEPGEFD
jgi:hypothetical protein